MNKQEFIDAVHKHMCRESGYEKVAAERAVAGMLKTIAEQLYQGEAVNITGFGKFEVKARAARQGRNPKTGETIHLPASKAVKFVPGKGLKEAIGS